jgi:RimJ/RimL family protein N-acetyltransferase
MDLANWKGVPSPERKTLEGRYARLVPLDPVRHGEELLASALEPGAEARFRYLFEDPPRDLSELMLWLEKSSASIDPLFFAVVDKGTGRAQGRQAFMRIEPAHGVIEVGHIL